MYITAVFTRLRQSDIMIKSLHVKHLNGAYCGTNRILSHKKRTEMTREQLKAHIHEVYGVTAEQPWKDDPTDEVFRRPDSGKWFGLVMDIPSDRVGQSGGNMTALNVKSEPFMVAGLIRDDGIYPAYHMNKTHWITIDLAAVPDEKIKVLIDVSYSLVAPKRRKIAHPSADF